MVVKFNSMGKSGGKAAIESLPKVGLPKVGLPKVGLSLEDLENKIGDWLKSEKRKVQKTALRYFNGKHDILYKNGKTEEESNGCGCYLDIEETQVDEVTRETLASKVNIHSSEFFAEDNRIVDNLYRHAVIQKSNYLVGKPISFNTDNKNYDDELKKIFDKRFMKLIKNICQDAINFGIGWLFVNYDESYNLKFTQLNPLNALPIWADEEHTKLNALIRKYSLSAIRNKKRVETEKIEVYTAEKVYYYSLKNNKLELERTADYFQIESEDTAAFSWGKIPVIPFKYNGSEQPLIGNVKKLQDALNKVVSAQINNTATNIYTSLIKVNGAEGDSPRNIRKNINQSGIISLPEGAEIDVVEIKVDCENFKAVTDYLKESIKINVMAFDANNMKSGTPNQMNIQSMYSDIELDSCGLEAEFQSSLEQLLEFINYHLYNTGKGDFEGEKVEFVFNKDMMLNESEVIENARKLVGILSNRTIIKNLPWTDDVNEELKLLEEEMNEKII